MYVLACSIIIIQCRQNRHAIACACVRVCVSVCVSVCVQYVVLCNCGYTLCVCELLCVCVCADEWAWPVYCAS